MLLLVSSKETIYILTFCDWFYLAYLWLVTVILFALIIIISMFGSHAQNGENCDALNMAINSHLPNDVLELR